MNVLMQQTQPIRGYQREPLEWPFETTAELLGLEVVRDHAQRHDFSHFAKHDDMLLAITRNSTRCIVVGYLADPARVDLPLWEE